MTKANNIGEKIRLFRKRANISQLDLETKISAAVGSISRIESGKVNPTKETLLKISEVLDLNPLQLQYLLGLTSKESTSEDIKKAKAAIEFHFQSEDTFAYLVDEKFRFQAFSAGFYGLAQMVEFNLQNLIGINAVEAVFDKSYGLVALLGDEVLGKMKFGLIKILFNEKEHLFLEEYWNGLVERLNGFDDFRALWRKLSEAKGDYHFVTAAEREIEFLIGGRKIKMHYQRTPLYSDPKFSIVEYKKS